MKFNAAFWKWFGKSKVVDESGQPLVVYHATNESFDTFDIEMCEFGCHFGTSAQGMSIVPEGEGREIAAYLSIQNPLRLRDRGQWDFFTVVDELEYLKKLGVRHGVRISEAELDKHEDDTDWLRKKLIKAGYDGIVYLNRREGISKEEADKAFALTAKYPEYWDYEATEEEFRKFFPSAADSWIVFSPTQIKSIGNDGTWDADDPDIRSNPPVDGIPILNIQEPWASLILDGRKVIETRNYPLPPDKVGVPILIAATNAGGPTQLIGFVVFSGCKKYVSKREFDADRPLHFVTDEYPWTKTKHGWIVEEAERIKPVPAPPRGIVWGRMRASL